MTRCLREYTLVMLHIGEGTQEEQTHLADCDHCSQRYQDLRRDWQRIGTAFHGAPPPRKERQPSFSLVQRWGPIAAAMATVVFFFAASTRWWQPTAPVVVTTTPQEEVASLVEDEDTVVPALFADESLTDVVLPTPVSDETYVQAALDGEWPCEQDEANSIYACEVPTFSLLLGDDFNS